ncbi:peptide/nickel transport system permease protein [Nocardioides scoriae]|uniref:Oligopeptide transport system permease protein OppC n=1 Tax=Nocardioides scoriae TaxID=642780 RepID=A0A1H1N0B9_9ACTN|nr:ABC transporter permease [Nocardioides scoriae]SDR92360.1 peptide/nickel transport system permease protein [Nocardioides scoriae]
MSTPLEPQHHMDPVPGDTNENAIALKEVEGLSQGQIVRRRFFRHRGALVGLVSLALVALLAYSSIGVLGIPGWWKFNHFTPGEVVNGGAPTMHMPTWLGGSGFVIGDHPFGQDEIGRDVFARVMKGTQTSLNVMVVISVLAALLGMVVGALSGYFRGGIDQGLMRLTDLFLTFPVIVIGAVLGKLAGGAGPFFLAVALGAVSWPTLARLVRGEFLSLREREFVDAAKVAGASSFRIMRKHMIPNAMGVIIVNTTLLASAAVLLETALSYLGFGIKSPDVSLGTMIDEYQSAFATRPFLFWWPGLFIIIIALSVNFIGDGLRDAFDPRQKRVPSARKMRLAATRSDESSVSGSVQ